MYTFPNSYLQEATNFTEFIVNWKNTNNAHSERLIPRITVNGYINELFPTGVPHYQASSPLLFDFQDETKIPLISLNLH